MMSLGKALLALAFLVALALPGIGGDGGESGGGTGVWVLPRATYLTAQTGVGVSAPLGAHTFPIAQDVVMAMSEEVGLASATFVDEVSGVPVALPVLGNLLRVPAALLQSLAQLSNPRATVVVSDLAGVGYVIKIVVNPATSTAHFTVF